MSAEILTTQPLFEVSICLMAENTTFISSVVNSSILNSMGFPSFAFSLEGGLNSTDLAALGSTPSCSHWPHLLCIHFWSIGASLWVCPLCSPLAHMLLWGILQPKILVLASLPYKAPACSVNCAFRTMLQRNLHFTQLPTPTLLQVPGFGQWPPGSAAAFISPSSLSNSLWCSLVIFKIYKLSIFSPI